MLVISVADGGFPRWRQLIIWTNFPESWIKIKKLKPGGSQICRSATDMNYGTGLRRTFTNFRHSSGYSGWVKEGGKNEIYVAVTYFMTYCYKGKGWPPWPPPPPSLHLLLQQYNQCYYRQRGKVMFSFGSVCNSLQGGGRQTASGGRHPLVLASSGISTASVGTHPTGMHACSWWFFSSIKNGTCFKENWKL